MPSLISVAQEPRSGDYAALITFAAVLGSLFSLVWRDQFDFSESAYAIAVTLQVDALIERSTDEWPGTRLLGHKATVGLYEMSASAVDVLLRPDGLYRWLAPAFPEDLAFYLAPDRPWLGSIAHEKEAFVHEDVIDVGELTKAVPGLRLGGTREAG